jgi:hypothetical protein
MSEPVRVEFRVHFERGARGRKKAAAEEAPRPACEPGRVPLVAKLLALAHRFDQLLCQGLVEDYATLARLGRVSRARISQVMSLLLLAPDIQEAVLFLPRTVRGRDPVRMHELLPIAAELDWDRQRRLWQGLRVNR